jgi:enterochelin esterase-like enzyme
MLAGVALAVLIVAGLAGALRYANDYLLYRGFGPPRASVPPPLRGRVTGFRMHSAALGGRALHVLVYLPPGYAATTRRYPAVYLLHGTPGDPKTAYINSLHVAPRLDAMLAHHQVQPMIVVMPPGSAGTYDRATEWANGPGRGQAWFTYLTRDLVHAVAQRYRVARTAAGRGIGGYSSGADAALNAFILRPGEYRVAEGWSGDFRQSPATVGHAWRLVRRFSAVDTAAAAAPILARDHAAAFLYAGRSDRVLPATLTVADALRRAGVSVRLDVTGGGHAWTLWSSRLDQSLRFFSTHLRA